jgi:hypothetical protein
LHYYNNERSHSGKYCSGKTPMQTWRESIHLAKEKLWTTLIIGYFTVDYQ